MNFLLMLIKTSDQITVVFIFCKLVLIMNMYIARINYPVSDMSLDEEVQD